MKPKHRRSLLLDQILQDLANFQTAVRDRLKRSDALIECSHRSNPKLWKPKHLNQDDSGHRGAPPLAGVQSEPLPTARKINRSILKWLRRAPPLILTLTIRSHVTEEIPDFWRLLKTSSEDPGKLVQPPGKQSAFVRSAAARLHAAAEPLNSL